MNNVLCYTLVALVIFLQTYECMETNKQQVKVIRFEGHYYNPMYFGEFNYSISKKNDTYNQVHFCYNMINDLPDDLRLISIIYITNSIYGNLKLLLQDYSFLREEAKYYNLLPPALVGADIPGVKYRKKGNSVNVDAGQFRFEILVPNLDKKGKHYKADYIVISSNDTILILTYYSQWGFL